MNLYQDLPANVLSRPEGRVQHKKEIYPFHARTPKVEMNRTSTPTSRPVRIFVSYSHQDSDYLEDGALLGFLRGLEKEGAEFWFDKRIGTGDLWDDEIKARIAESSIALVLVSQAFLDSEYCQKVEIASFLARELVIFPVILSACEWQRHEWLRSRQFLPRGNETVEEHYVEPGYRKRLYLEIRKQLRDWVEKKRIEAAEVGDPSQDLGGPVFESRPSRSVPEAGRRAGHAEPEVVSGGVMAVPELPPHYLQRSDHLEALKRALLLGDTDSQTGNKSSGKITIQGMAGIGKTVLAAAVARDPDVLAAFPEVLWINVGKGPNLLQIQSEIAAAVGHAAVFTSVRDGKSQLQRLLADRRILLVLDDLWEIDDAWALDVAGAQGRLLNTTRNQEIVVLGTPKEEHRVDVLSPRQALDLLAKSSGQAADALPEIAERVAEACGHLPLALAMIGAMVRLRPTAWEDALYRLEHADLDRIRQRFPDYPYPDLLCAIEVSVEALDDTKRRRYFELAVFPKDTAVPVAAVEVLWSAQELNCQDAHDLIEILITRSLLGRVESGRLMIHNLHVDYMLREVGDIGLVHQQLVDAYATQCPAGFPDGPDDGYFFQHLPRHLVGAGGSAELGALLVDYNWLAAKMAATDVNALIADYDWLTKGEDLRLVQEALRLSAHVLVKDPRQLAAQLLGRLEGSHNRELARLIRTARSHQGKASWLRPLWPSLHPPGAALLRKLEGHSDCVNAVAELPGGRVISASDDRSLRVWDIETGETLRRLEGHSGAVNGVVMVSVRAVSGSRLDGCVVSASEDRTLRVWNFETGETLQTFEGHSAQVKHIALLSGGRVISSSADKTLRVWDVASGATLQHLKGHLDWVLCAAELPGDRVVSASADKTLRVWDIKGGETLQRLAGHTGWVKGVAVLSDGRVASASQDQTLRVWDVDRGETLVCLKGHTGFVNSVETLSGGYVISASDDETLRVWDVESGKALKCFEGHSGGFRSVEALADGRVVSACEDGTLRVWDVERSDTLKHHRRHSGGVTGLAFLSEEQVVSSSVDGTLQVWSLASGKLLRRLEGHSSGVTGVATLSDGRIISTSDDGTLRLWRIESGETLRCLKGHYERVLGVAALPDGRVVSGSLDRTLLVWDIESGEVLQCLEGHTGGIKGLTVSSAGYVVSASDDRTLRVWDVDKGESLQCLEGHSGSIWSVAALPRNRVISASADTTLRVWDIENARTEKRLEGHTGRVLGVAVLSDGRVVSASHDHTVRVWDVDRGQTLAVFETDESIWSVAALGQTVVAGDQSGQLHVLRFEEP